MSQPDFSRPDSSVSSPKAQVISFIMHRSDSAANTHHKQSDVFLRPPHISQHVDSNNIQTSESLFTQGGSQSLYNSASNLHLAPDYLSDSDTLPLKPSEAPKSSTDLNAGPFRSSFSAFNGMNGTHTQGGSVPPNAFRMRQPDTLVTGSQSFGASSENHSTHQPLRLKHQLSQQSHQGSSLPSATFEPRNVDFSGNLPLSNKTSQSFTLDPFGQAHSVKSQLQPQTHDSFHSLSHNASAAQVPYLNGVHVQSQTPYGPHLQSNGNPVSSSRAMAAASQSSALEPPGNQQEEISTIFVVGFPDDMQEREFQNMFTFSPGFEAATLKIPNKEYTAYGSNGHAANQPLRGGSSYASYLNSGQNDPYNIVTVNQGGVVVDNGRDGPTTSWPPLAVPLADDPGHFQGGSGGQPPRKQIIGFAKFRTRQEALEARDVLQGRRIDVEKGAVLKAEMAKKNLHTKRGVGIGNTNSSGGSISINGVSPLGNLGNNVGGLANLSGLTPDTLTGLTAGLSLNTNIGLNAVPSLSSGDPLNTREGSLGALYRNVVWRDGRLGDSSEEERESRDLDRERRREALSSMGIGVGLGTRGARERALAEEELRRKDIKQAQTDALRMLQGHTTSYDAFYSLPRNSQPGFHASGNGNGDAGHGSQGSSPFPGNGYRTIIAQTSVKDEGVQISNGREVSVGPWDHPSPREREVVGYPGLASLYVTRKGSVVPPRPSSSQDNSPKSSHVFSPTLDDEGMLPSHRSGALRSIHFQSVDESVQTQPSRPSLPPSSSASSTGAPAEVDGTAPLVVSTSAQASTGSTSPQLPSPASHSESGVSSAGGHAGSPSSAGGPNGTSGSGLRNALVDQNPPINTLYVGNLPTGTVGGFPTGHLEDSLRELFSRRPGYRKLCFRQKSNGPMCFVEFEDVHYATKALNELYGNTLGGLVKNGGIRLSYSKNPLGVRTPTSAGAGSSLQQQQNAQLGKASMMPAEAFQHHQAFDSDSNIAAIRREPSNITSPQPSAFGYSRSPPPPRFFSPPPASGNFGTVSSAAPLNATTFPRGSHSFGVSIGGSGGATNFSPFGLPLSSPPTQSNAPPSHSMIPDHPSSEVTLSHPQHFPHRALSPSSTTLEAARAG
ncbi:hypothetical protein SCLCIDRAFT_116764 [Scleroderma citrinum Foug A]|uniref:RRM domain-containing protein n=1 Tax=Scleroderma citrinum Foug A TaxID=1036808 RepID=A0A0C3E5K3_9AGAM|nr:hypothetical protein SCLCIDRAFT_116764 [Scleroderma citrinum Foug A]